MLAAPLYYKNGNENIYGENQSHTKWFFQLICFFSKKVEVNYNCNHFWSPSTSMLDKNEHKFIGQ